LFYSTEILSFALNLQDYDQFIFIFINVINARIKSGHSSIEADTYCEIVWCKKFYETAAKEKETGNSADN